MTNVSSAPSAADRIEGQPGEQPEPVVTPFSPAMLVFPFFIELTMLLLGAITVDGGGVFKIALGTFMSHCLGIVLVVSRRRNRLTKGDLIYIKLGFVLFWLIAPFFLKFWMDYALRHHWTWLLGS